MHDMAGETRGQDMHAKMKEAGINAEIEIYETGGHGCQSKDAAGSMARMVVFLKTLVEQETVAEGREEDAGAG